MIAVPWAESGDGILLTVRVTPKASRTALVGTVSLPDGRAALAIRLAAPPVDGAANAELIAFLGKMLGVPKSAVTLATGQTGRLKTVRLSGDCRALAHRLKAATEPA